MGDRRVRHPGEEKSVDLSDWQKCTTHLQRGSGGLAFHLSLWSSNIQSSTLHAACRLRNLVKVRSQIASATETVLGWSSRGKVKSQTRLPSTETPQLLNYEIRESKAMVRMLLFPNSSCVSLPLFTTFPKKGSPGLSPLEGRRPEVRRLMSFSRGCPES